MAQLCAWVGFITLMGFGLILTPSLLNSFPFSSVPLISSYSSGILYSDLPLPLSKEIKGQWNQFDSNANLAAKAGNTPIGDKVEKYRGEFLGTGKYAANQLTRQRDDFD